jgi:hypothetical protein
VSMNDVPSGSKAPERFLALDYVKLSVWKRFYFLLRTGESYDLVSSQPTIPTYEDRDQLKTFLEHSVISDNDVSIFKRRGKSYFVIRNESVLNAMRICN